MESTRIIGNGSPLNGELTPPGDKSISHRAFILGSIANGVTDIKGILISDDTLSTKKSMEMVGAEFKTNKNEIIIKGKGLHRLKEPENIIDAGNSGTTARLVTGLLSAQNFFSCITGDQYLRKRPMARVIKPLSEMGARIWAKDNNTLLPIAIKGTKLKAISYKSPVSSAQVKSSIMLAGLYADGVTEISEPYPSRDHSERMFSHFGINLSYNNRSIRMSQSDEFTGTSIYIPSDISSAAYFIVAALINPNSEILLKNIGINPYRTGIIKILRDMGGNIEITNKRESNNEPIGDIIAKSSYLKSVEIKGDIIPRLIDEIPVIAVAACFAEGETVIKDAKELRVKETDRISAVVTEFNKLGANIQELEDGIVIKGSDQLTGSFCDSWGDHRIAMSLAIAATRAGGETVINNSESVSISYPDFFTTLDRLRQ